MTKLTRFTIYQTCKNNYKKQIGHITPSSSSFCNSKNFKAIADMNLFTYNFHTQNGASLEIRKPYLENYLKYQQIALDAENQEVNANQNTAWRAAKKDGKKLWEQIDWKGRADAKNETLIHESEIIPYFKNIFQSEKTKDHPRINDGGILKIVYVTSFIIVYAPYFYFGIPICILYMIVHPFPPSA